MSHIPRPLTRQRPSTACILVCCLGFLLATSSRAAAQAGAPPVVIFGDSLSDSGNAFAFVHANATPPNWGLNELLVPQAPYAIGGHHFTNGDTWIEQLAARFGLGRYTLPAFASANPDAMNFAIATARARDDGTCSLRPLPDCNPSLAVEIATFLQKSGGVAPPAALYVVQIGGNDVRDALALAFGQPPKPLEAAAILEAAARSTAEGIATLYAAGARHFLVWNVPTQALTPAARLLTLRIPDFQSGAAFATGLFNNTYQPMALEGVEALPGISIRVFDVDALFASVFFFPGRFGFTNVTDACVMPDIAPFRCPTPDQYLFWDGIHPTAAAHGVIARAVALFLTQ